MLEIVDLDLDKTGGGLVAAGRYDFGELGGKVGQGNGGEVVVFDQQAIVKPHAVVDAAAGAYGIFFQKPPAGSGFAGVVNAGGGAGGRQNVSVSEGGNAGEALEEVEDDALGGEERAHGAADFEDG